MKFLPDDTLAAFEEIPQKQRFDLSGRPIKLVSAQVKAYRKSCGEVSPDIRAIEFYGMNQIYGRLRQRFTRNERLPSWAKTLAMAYRQTLVEQGERMMHYFLSIITREIRHLSAAKLSNMKAQVQLRIGDSGLMFVSGLLNGSEDTAVDMLMNCQMEFGVGSYCRALEYLFDHGWGGKTSYGGKAWGRIAQCVADFFEGKTSLEVMVDTAYTLAHNNGPTFNKGMMFSHYTPNFVMLLDIQRSGQIVEAVRDKNAWMKNWFTYNVVGFESYVQIAVENMPKEFGEYVDWHKVEELGAPLVAPNKYLSQKEQQNLKYGAPKPKPKATVKYMGHPAAQVGTFVVAPGEEVEVFERVKEIA